MTFDPWCPPWLILALAVPLVVLVLLRHRRRGLVRAGIVALLALAAAGPQLGAEAVVYRERPDAQVLVALDRTASMGVTDQHGRARLAAAVDDLRAILADSQAPVAVVTWGDGPRQALPFTTDTPQVLRTLDAVTPQPPVSGIGSRIDVPLPTLRAVARRSGSRELYVVLLSDGENTEPGTPHSYAPLGRLTAGGVVVGYGSRAGGPIPLGEGRPGFVPALDGRGDAVSRRDDADLRRVAQQLGVPYRVRSEVSSPAQLAALLVPPYRDVPGPTVRHDVTWAVGLLLLLLVVWELRTATRTTAEALRIRVRA